MRYAIIGAGLAGLAIAYFLRQKQHQVTLFDHKGIGGGASGIASGLCHPYPGSAGRRSPFATEALAVTRELIEVAEGALGRAVALQNGILRLGWINPPDYDDLELCDEGILVRSGMTLSMPDYLEGLFLALEGSELVRERIDDLERLSKFDHVVIAAGAGVRKLAPTNSLQYIKGQILTCKTEQKWDRSIGMFGNGYLTPLFAHSDQRDAGNYVQLGATYEHHYRSDEPDLEVALSYLKPRMERFIPAMDNFRIIACHAAERVAVKGSSIPLILRQSERTSLFTGLGSRGLLYHGYYGRQLASAIS